MSGLSQNPNNAALANQQANALAGLAQQANYANQMQGVAGQALANVGATPSWMNQPGPGFSFNYNDHVPVWDEGGYEPWLGKPSHTFADCQRCLFV